MSDDLNPDNPDTLKAYDFIRKQILEGIYSPGRRLQTIGLAAEIGLSRTPVREALRQLHSEGLVDIRPRLGASVRTFSLDEFQQMCELRLALESFAAELAARKRSAEDMVEIQEALNQMNTLVDDLERSPDREALVNELVEQDIRFHFAILNAAGNPLIKSEVLRLHILNRVVRMNLGQLTVSDGGANESPHLRRRLVLECHRKIMAAILSRQPEAARNAMQEHIGDIIDRSMVAMARLQKRPNNKDLAVSERKYAAYG